MHQQPQYAQSAPVLGQMGMPVMHNQPPQHPPQPAAAPVALMPGVGQAYYAPIVVTVMPGKPPRGRAVHPEWNPTDDARRLRAAMKGLGTDNSDVIHIICSRDRDHLQYVRLEYRNLFGRHLLHDLEKETSFFFKDVIAGLVMSDAEYRAHVLHEATKGAGTRDSTLIDVICTATASQLAATKIAYSALFHADLDHVIKKETSGNFENLLIALLRCTRPDWGVVQATVQSDVEILWKATEGKIGTDEKTCIEIITARSHDHMAVVDKAFIGRSKKKHDLRKCLDSETSGNFKISLQAAMTDVCHWFAHRIHFAAKGLGTNDTMLIQCLLLPNQWQVQDIYHILKAEHGKDLIQLIRSETSGNYRNALTSYVENCLRP